MKNKKTRGKSGNNRERAAHKQRYEMLWRNKHLTVEAKSITEMADLLQGAANDLRAMTAAGVVLESDGVENDHARLTTTDPEVAEQFGFTPMERWDEE